MKEQKKKECFLAAYGIGILIYECGCEDQRGYYSNNSREKKNKRKVGTKEASVLQFFFIN